MSKIKKAMRRRQLTVRCQTPICGKMVTQLDCKSFDITRCHWICSKDLDNDQQVDLFEPTEEDLEDMFKTDKAKRELTTNMDHAEWEDSNGL